jgi:excisionase family DNA binding protein
MTFEETLGALLDAKLWPYRDELRRLADEMAALRSALPPMLVTVREAAKALGISVSTLRRRVREGSVPVRRIGRGRCVRVDLSALRAPTEAEVIRLATQTRSA